MTHSFAPPAAKALPAGPAKRGVQSPAPDDRSTLAADEDRWTELAVILLDMLESAGPESAAGATDPRAMIPARPETARAPTTTETGGDPAATGESAAATATPRALAPLPGGSDAALLKGEEKPRATGPVPMPDFPQGGTPLPEAARPTAPPEGAPKPAGAPPAPASGENQGPSPGAIVRRWQGQVRAGGAAIPQPDVKVPAEGAARLARVGSGAQKRNAAARDGMTKDAVDTVPKPPEIDTTPPAPPPPNPVPEHTQKVLAASGKRLPDQQSIALSASPEREIEGQKIGGTMPPLGVRPVDPDLFQVLITPTAKTLAQLPPGASAEDIKNQTETPEQRRVRFALETLTRTGDAADRKGRGPEVIAPDIGPFKAEGTTPENRARIGELVARLMANTQDTAGDILVRLRKKAFPGEALFRNFPDICSDMLDGLKTALTGDLGDIADAAGISGAELDEMVARRRKELEDAKTKAADTVSKQAVQVKKTVTEEGQKTSDAIAGAAEAAEEETLRRQTAVAGENDPTVVNARRDRIVAWFREHVTTQITNYQRAGDKRQTELTKARTEQQDAYRALAQREIYQVMTPAPPRADRDQNDKPREMTLADMSVKIRLWSDERLKIVGEHFRKALALASATTDSNRKAIEGAGSAGIEAARRWAEDKILAGKSWWQRFVARIRRWLGEAKDVNEQWRVRRGRENAKAIADDILGAELAAKALAKDVDQNTAQQINQMTDAQKAAFGTFYNKAKGKHPLDFAADRLSDNLTRDHQAGATQRFEAALIATPVSGGDHATANKLNDVARSQGAGFDAARIAQNVHAAMDQWGTDEQRIFDSLRSMTVLQGAVVRKMYRAIFDSDLDSDLESEMSGEELDQAMAELEGKQAKADAIALHDAMAGLGTDEATIMRTLRNKSEAEREAIRAEYLRLYGVTLDADLKDDLSDGNEIDQANALLAGDNELADAIEFDEAMRGGIISTGTDEKRIEEVQNRVRTEVLAMAKGQNWTSDEMEAEVRRRLALIEKKFGERYAKVEQYNEPGLEGETVLRRAFKSELSGAELDLANALQDNDLIKADAARIEIERTGFYASDDRINGVLRSQYERALEARRLDEGPARNMRVRRLVDDLRHEPGVSDNEVSRRRMALERQMEKEIQDGAQQDSRLSMDSLKQVYQDKYFWPLEYVVEVNMSGEDRIKARNMLEQGGRLDPLQEIEYATRTAGTDEETVRRVVGRMTKAELEVLAAQWEKRHPGKRFRDMLIGELDGRDLSDVLDMYDHGKPTSALEAIAQEERRVDREANQLTGVLGGAAAGHEAAWMKSELGRLQELKAGLLRTDWPDTDEAREERARLTDELDFRVERVQAAVEDHRRRIDSVTDMAAQIVGIVVAIVAAAIITVVTAGTAGPVMVLILASLYATVATMATKLLIKGGAYGTQDFAIDAAVGVVDAAMSAATAGLGTKILGPIKTLVSATRLPALAGRIGRTGVAQRLAGMEGMGLAARAGRAIAPTREGVERAVARFAAEGIEDAASSVPSTMIQTMADDNVWKGDPLANFLSGTGMGLAQSVAMSRTLDLSRTAAGGLFRMGHSAIFEPGNIGRVKELNRIIGEHFDSFRQENPNASIGEFLASPQGRKARAEIEQSGLMKEIRASAEAAEAAAGSRPPRGDAEGETARPASAPKPDVDGTPAHPDPAGPRIAAMRAVLPDMIREGTFVTPDPDLPGRSVHVEPLRIGNRIVGVDVRVGPGATAIDVALHSGTIHAMQKYMGVLGNVRRVLHDLINNANATGLTIGSRGWEAQLELAKLPAIIHERMEALAKAGSSPDAVLRAQSEVRWLDAQLLHHRTILSDPRLAAQQGRGFVAADDIDDADAAREMLKGSRPKRIKPKQVDTLFALAKGGNETAVIGHLTGMSHLDAEFARRAAQAVDGVMGTDYADQLRVRMAERKADARERQEGRDRLRAEQLPERVRRFVETMSRILDTGAQRTDRMFDETLDWMTNPQRPKASEDEGRSLARFEWRQEEMNAMHEITQLLGRIMDDRDLTLRFAVADASRAGIPEFARHDELLGKLADIRRFNAALGAATAEGNAGNLARLQDALSRLDVQAREKAANLLGHLPIREEGFYGRRPASRETARTARGETEIEVIPGTSGKLEGMLERSILEQNIDAMEQARGFIRDFDPDLVLGVQRGGAFLLESLGPGFRTEAVPKAPTHENENLGGFEQPKPAGYESVVGTRGPHLVKAIIDAIGDGTRDSYRFVVLDVMMGGLAIGDIRRNVFDEVMRRLPEHVRPKVKFESIWLREQHGFERSELAPEVTNLLDFLNLSDNPAPIMGRLRDAAHQSDEAFRAAVLEFAMSTVRQDLTGSDAPMDRMLSRSASWGKLTDPEALAVLRDIFRADPEQLAHLLGDGLEARRPFEAEIVREGVNVTERIIPVRLAAGDDMKIVMEPGTSSDPIVIVDIKTGEYRILPVGTMDPVTQETLSSQRAIVAAILQGHFKLDW
ncbi:hypothetical protein EYF88_10905 [Paracoccus sediminis]|uniref:Annexin n=1 Tax=Paracoccus sediminis TaxID=1214787 RepID=A0A238WXQ8_9RHOB|nr:hypothetical protein [Paracoccus sediminis]TBN50121.1 hypothetical protein EYF88_10905 [Paracoccus sediminis]SNR51306.1 Annexin [Paracoccus sediminis]